MSDRETEFLQRWRSERDMYRAWGDYVAETLAAAVAKVIEPATLELFFRMPVKSRTKNEASLLAKAFYRGKSYADPYGDIEDKVGLRIIVLFSEEIRLVERALKSCAEWTATKARDFEEERHLKPFEFDYQSLHYVVRSKAGIRYHDVDIAEELPCEVQVRTILQHAYSELTHDTIYKPSVKAEPDVKRAAAKSMALIEATDDYFTQVRDKLERVQEPGSKVAGAIDALYSERVGKPEPGPLNHMMVDFFKQWAKEGFETDLSNFYDGKPFLIENVAERSATQLLYRQPAILLAYWAINQAPRGVAEQAPLSPNELAPLYSDLGLRMPHTGA